MGSSGGSNDEEPPQAAPPPANMIAPQGQTAPFQPHFINFLGDPSTPSTGLTPDMLAQISAMNGPAPGASGGASAGSGLTSASDIELNKLRDQLAALQAGPTDAEKRQKQMDAWQNRERGGGYMRGGFGGGG